MTLPRILTLRPGYGNAGKCPVTLSPSTPCRVMVADAQPLPTEPGETLTSLKTFLASPAGSYCWVAPPIAVVRQEPPPGSWIFLAGRWNDAGVYNDAFLWVD